MHNVAPSRRLGGLSACFESSVDPADYLHSYDLIELALERPATGGAASRDYCRALFGNDVNLVLWQEHQIHIVKSLV